MNPYDLPGMKRAAAKRRISPSHAPATSPEPADDKWITEKAEQENGAMVNAGRLSLPTSPGGEPAREHQCAGPGGKLAPSQIANSERESGGEPATMEILICVGEKCGECLLCSNADLRRQLQQEQAQIRAERENWLDVMMPHHKFEIDLVLKRAETAERQLQEAREEIERLKT